MTVVHTNPARLFISGLLSFAVCGAVPSLWGLAIPIFARDFGLSETQAGVILSVNAAGAFSAVIAGILGLPGITGRSSFGMLAVGSAAAAAAPTWGLILAGTFLIGAGFGTSAAVFNRRFLTEFGPKGPAMIGLLNAIWALGAILAPLFVVWASGRPSMVLWGIAAVSLAMIPVVQPSGRAVARLALARPPLRSLVLPIATLSVIVEVSIMGFGPARLIAGGMTDAAAAQHLSGFFVAFLLGRLGLSVIASRMSGKHVFIAAQLSVAAVCGIAIYGHTSFAFVLMGAPVGMAFPAIFVWLSHVLGPDPRASHGIVAASLSGAIIGPVILGLMIEAFGLVSLFHITAFLAITVALFATAAGMVLNRANGVDAAL